MAKALGPQLVDETPASFHRAVPTPRATQWVQTVLGAPLFILSGIRWLLYLLTASAILRLLPGFDVLPSVAWPALVIGLLVFATPFGRMAIAVASARLLLAGVRAGDYPRGGWVHIRLWLAEQISDQVDAVGLAGAPWVSYYARALGARIGRDVDLHALPPVTGLLVVGDGASIEPEVDLTGYWIDGDLVRIGEVRIGAEATVGARSTLAPGTRIGRRAEIAPGSAVFGRVKADQSWAGSPAVRVGGTAKDWPTERPAMPTRWLWAYAASAMLLAILPLAAFTVGGLVLAQGIRGSATLAAAAGAAFAWLVPAVAVTGLVFAASVVLLVRVFSLGLVEWNASGRSRIAWQAWTIERLLDAARTILFPLYSSLFTPVWLRMLGARVGRDVEASTVLLIPSMARIEDGAFLADDTMVASYELRAGWMRLGPVRIGKRAFLGNSGMAAPATACRATGSSPCCRPRPGRRRPGRRGSVRPRCAFDACRRRATSRARTGRPRGCGWPAPCGSCAVSSPSS